MVDTMNARDRLAVAIMGTANAAYPAVDRPYEWYLTPNDLADAIIAVDRSIVVAFDHPIVAAITQEHHECGMPRYDGCFSHWPTPHCRACGNPWPCDVQRIAEAITIAVPDHAEGQGTNATDTRRVRGVER